MYPSAEQRCDVWSMDLFYSAPNPVSQFDSGFARIPSTPRLVESVDEPSVLSPTDIVYFANAKVNMKA